MEGHELSTSRLRAKMRSWEKDRTRKSCLALAWPPALSKREATSVFFWKGSCLDSQHLRRAFREINVSSGYFHPLSSLTFRISPLAYGDQQACSRPAVPDAHSRHRAGNEPKGPDPKADREWPWQPAGWLRKGSKSLLLRQEMVTSPLRAHLTPASYSNCPESGLPRPLPKMLQQLSPNCLGPGPACWLTSPFDCVTP